MLEREENEAVFNNLKMVFNQEKSKLIEVDIKYTYFKKNYILHLKL